MLIHFMAFGLQGDISKESSSVSGVEPNSKLQTRQIQLVFHQPMFNL